MEQNNNRLSQEKSLYLLQHVHNPVAWYPWGDAAFEAAKAENKPVFLSIGYSTCHWCHVMAHESFENQEIAAFLNQRFICIKVDREERPDIDSVYMAVCQAMTGSGGWPLSVFLDSCKQPFYAGTYYPPAEFLNLLIQIDAAYQNEKEALIKQARHIVNAVKPEPRHGQKPNISVVHTAYRQLKAGFDEKYGGFSRAPKFPTPHNILFLLEFYQIAKEQDALKMAVKTLDGMREGGIYDHIGFGFSRYSTDREWLVPHFEKMLYDNALLIIAYSEAFRITGYQRFADTAAEIITYLKRDMRSGEGGFYTAEDADSEGREGLFYTFTNHEILQTLGSDSESFCNYYHVKPGGNFEGRNILNRIGSISTEKDYAKIEACRRKLFELRQTRIRPHLDDKLLTSFNGLTIAALSAAGRALGNDAYIEDAKETAEFIQKHLFKNGKLFARFRDGESRFHGYAEDYAFFIYGLLELYESCFEKKYLNLAKNLNEEFIRGFYDADAGGFTLSCREAEQILYKPKEIYDGAIPSANAVAVHNLRRLAALTHDETLHSAAEKTLEFFMSEIAGHPAGHTFSCVNIMEAEYGSTDIVLAGDSLNELLPMLETVRNSKLPFYNLSICFNGENPDYKTVGGKAAAYICKGHVCLPPITDLARMKECLSERKFN